MFYEHNEEMVNYCTIKSKKPPSNKVLVKCYFQTKSVQPSLYGMEDHLKNVMGFDDYVLLEEKRFS